MPSCPLRHTEPAYSPATFITVKGIGIRIRIMIKTTTGNSNQITSLTKNDGNNNDNKKKNNHNNNNRNINNNDTTTATTSGETREKRSRSRSRRTNQQKDEVHPFVDCPFRTRGSTGMFQRPMPPKLNFLELPIQPEWSPYFFDMSNCQRFWESQHLCYTQRTWILDEDFYRTPI